MRTVLLMMILSLAACSKNMIDEAIVPTPTAHTLDFLLQPIDYTTTEEQPIVPLSLLQDADYGYQVQLHDVEDRYFWFLYSHLPMPADSANIIVSINYKMEGSELDFTDVMLEFVYAEALDLLEPQADGSYRYKELAALYNRLITDEWGKKGWSQEKSQLLLSTSEKIDQQGYSSYATSNGTYFDEEQAELASVSFNADTQSITIRGSIDSYVKELSCGFYCTHSITNGIFTGIIE